MMVAKQTPVAMILFLAVGAASFPRAASGQLPVAGTTALATANNYTALARGFTAIALNPAGLGMPGNPGFSLALVPIEGRAGLSGLTLGEIAEFSDLPLSKAKREEWLQRVEEKGAFTTRAGVSGTAFALSAGPIGLQISSVGQANTAMSPDAFELFLFGNSGRTGTPRDMTLDSTAVDGWWASTAAVALGIPLPDFQGGNFSAGVTLKYTVGHVVVTADDAGSVIDGVPVRIGLSIPSIATESLTFDFDNGTGLGMDLGLAWQDSTWAASVSVQNVFNSFQWKLESLAYRPGVFIANVDSISSDFDAVPATSAPMALQGSVLAQRFEPTFTLGLAYRHSDKLALTADLHHDSGDALVFGGSHIGLGVEFLAIPILPLRGGLSSVSGGVQFAVGFGLVLGPVNLSGAYLTERGTPGEYRAASFALSFGHN